VVVRFDQPSAAAHGHFDRAHIAWALQATGDRVEVAARMLGLSRKGLYLKRQRLGLQPAGEGGAPLAWATFRCKSDGVSASYPGFCLLAGGEAGAGSANVTYCLARRRRRGPAGTVCHRSPIDSTAPQPYHRGIDFHVPF